MKRGIQTAVAIAAALVLVLVMAPGAAEADDHLTVVAEGLDNPRGLDIAPRGAIYVAEAGTGGDTLVDVVLGEGGPVCVGLTGSITRVNPRNGRTRVILDYLPSVTTAVDGACVSGAFATGIHDVSVIRGGTSFSLGLGGDDADRDALSAAVVEAYDFSSVTELGGPLPSTISLVDFEAAFDPNGDGVDSNAYGVLRTGRGVTVAADAGGNSLIRTNRNDSVDVLATFTPICVAWNQPFPNPVPPEANPCGEQSLFPADAVPTDVAQTADGDYLVTTLGGFPFAVGGSVVYRIDGDFEGTANCSGLPIAPSVGCEVFADGLTSLVAIDIDADGNVYVVQFADAGVGGLGSGAFDGSVRVFDPAGAPIATIDGLTLPGGVVVADDGTVYITNNSTFPGAGQIVSHEGLS